MKKKESDISLLVSQLGSDAALKILNGELGAYKGAIAENMCAIGFHSVGKELYYFRGSSGSPELDFIISIDEQPTIVECKATNNLKFKPTEQVSFTLYLFRTRSETHRDRHVFAGSRHKIPDSKCFGLNNYYEYL